MAPKPPPADKKGDAKEKPEDGKEPAEGKNEPSVVKQFFESDKGRFISAVATGTLIILAIGCTIVTIYEWIKPYDTLQAMAILRNHIIKGGTSKDTPDLSILEEADDTVKKLHPSAKFILDLQKAIAEILYRLHHEWFYYNGVLYAAPLTTMNWSTAKDYCEEGNGRLFEMYSWDSMNWVLSRIANRTRNYWLGGYNNGSDWKWVTNDTTIIVTFWKDTPRISKGQTAYIQMLTACSQSKCWVSYTEGNKEGSEGRPFCERFPEKRFLP